MSDLQSVADRFEIEMLRGEFTDAVMMRDYDRLASLFTPDVSVRMPRINAEATSREQIRAGVGQMQGLLDYFVQTTHPGTIELEGEIASGRAYISELMRGRDGSSHLNYAVYHDRYQRTPDGWKFTERLYEIRYVDTSPPIVSLRARPRQRFAVRRKSARPRRQYSSISFEEACSGRPAVSGLRLGEAEGRRPRIRRELIRHPN